jgi:hypothetical protein
MISSVDRASIATPGIQPRRSADLDGLTQRSRSASRSCSPYQAGGLDRPRAGNDGDVGSQFGCARGLGYRRRQARSATRHRTRCDAPSKRALERLSPFRPTRSTKRHRFLRLPSTRAATGGAG